MGRVGGDVVSTPRKRGCQLNRADRKYQETFDRIDPTQQDLYRVSADIAFGVRARIRC